MTSDLKMTFHSDIFRKISRLSRLSCNVPAQHYFYFSVLHTGKISKKR